MRAPSATNSFRVSLRIFAFPLQKNGCEPLRVHEWIYPFREFFLLWFSLCIIELQLQFQMRRLLPILFSQLFSCCIFRLFRLFSNWFWSAEICLWKNPLFSYRSSQDCCYFWYGYLNLLEQKKDESSNYRKTTLLRRALVTRPVLISYSFRIYMQSAVQAAVCGSNRDE